MMPSIIYVFIGNLHIYFREISIQSLLPVLKLGYSSFCYWVISCKLTMLKEVVRVGYFVLFLILIRNNFVFVFMLFRVCWASWMCRLMFFSKFGKIELVIIWTFILSLSLSFWYSYYMYVGIGNDISHFSESFFRFLKIFFISLDYIILIDLF